MNLAALLQEGEYPASPEIVTVSAPALTLQAVRHQFTEYLARVQDMARDAELMEVGNDEQLKFAVALGGEAAKISKRIDAKRKEVTSEASDFVKSVNGFCKEYTERLNDVVTVTKKKIGEYQYRQELERRKQVEAARKAATELQDRLRREAEEANRKSREEATRKAEEESARLRAIAEEEARKRMASEDELKSMREQLERDTAEALRKAEEDARRHAVQAPAVMTPFIPEQERIARADTGAAAHVRKAWKAEVEDDAQVPREYLAVDMKRINDAVRMGVREIPGVRIYEDITTVIRS